MKTIIFFKKACGQRRPIVLFVLLSFLLTIGIGPAGSARAQEAFQLPQPGTRVSLSPSFIPPLLKGVKVYPQDPFRLDFILDGGERRPAGSSLHDDATRLIKYFLAAITVPEKDLWVNLSPYEKDRIVPDAFGQTEMVRDLLAQDYLLKQITASVTDPEGQAGREFWARVYAEARERFGTADIPVDTFNKVWIVPEKAVVYETKDAAYVVESRLKVMLESDYLAQEKSVSSPLAPVPGQLLPSPLWGGNGRGADVAKNILREIVIPILEKEVNEGRNFAHLRQVYNSLILAVWFKDRIRSSIFGKAYIDQDKVAGIDIKDRAEKDRIWAQYVESFKKGVYNFIREEKDAVSGEMIPRKYFSGGMRLENVREVIVLAQEAQLSGEVPDHAMIVRADMSMTADPGIFAKPELIIGIPAEEGIHFERQRLLKDPDWEFIKSRGVDDFVFGLAMRNIDRTGAVPFGLKPSKEGRIMNVDQFELIRRDFERILREKNGGKKEITIYQFGLGRKFLETEDILNALQAAFEGQGILPAQRSIPGTILPDAQDHVVDAAENGEGSGFETAQKQQRERVRRKQEDLIKYARSLAARFPQYPWLAWESAAIVPWGEVVRDTERMEPDGPVIQDTEYFSLENRWNYWANQLDARRVFLDMLAGSLVSMEGVSFRDVLEKAHSDLILGEGQDSPYRPATHKSFSADNDLVNIATTMRLSVRGLERLKTEFGLFVPQIKGHTLKPKSLFPTISSIYLTMMWLGSYDEFEATNFTFRFGNHSLVMNFINATLRLCGLSGIRNGHFDYDILWDNGFKGNRDKALAYVSAGLSRLVAEADRRKADPSQLGEDAVVMALSEQEIAKLETLYPEYDWRNAAVVVWPELTRQAGQKIKNKNQMNYFGNQVVVRREFLHLVRDILSGDLDTKTFIAAVQRIHTLLLTATGPYDPSSEDLHEKSSSYLEQIKGKLRDESWARARLQIMQNDLGSIFSRDVLTGPRNRIVSLIARFYADLIVEQRNLFPKGNHSWAMQLVNTMLRLYGLKGIPHGFLDELIRYDEFKTDVPAEIVALVKEANKNVQFDEAYKDPAMEEKGGIDLTRDTMRLKVNSDGQGARFNFDPAMVRRLESAAGITPVIIDICPMTTSVPAFLGSKNGLSETR